ncbi:hypothetical protein GCM10027563_14140 [Parasphingorhabdus pacifica]
MAVFAAVCRNVAPNGSGRVRTEAESNVREWWCGGGATGMGVPSGEVREIGPNRPDWVQTPEVDMGEARKSGGYTPTVWFMAFLPKSPLWIRYRRTSVVAAATAVYNPRTVVTGW